MDMFCSATVESESCMSIRLSNEGDDVSCTVLASLTGGKFNFSVLAMQVRPYRQVSSMYWSTVELLLRGKNVRSFKALVDELAFTLRIRQATACYPDRQITVPVTDLFTLEGFGG